MDVMAVATTLQPWRMENNGRDGNTDIFCVHRSKQTQAEAVKLKRIQKELQALDDMVSNDIGILRDRIEQASWEYSTAR